MQLAIILIYFAVTIAVGVYAKKKATSSDSFHGAGLGVVMCVAAGTGEWLGGTATTGITEYGYAFGISGAWYTIANAIGVFVLALFFAKLYRSLNTVTVPGIMGHFIGGRARTVASIMLIFVMLAVGTSQIIAAGTLGVSILGLSFPTSVLILGICFIVYTIAGGMNAVGSTNILHLIAMYGGVIVALIFLVVNYGGFDYLNSNLDTSVYYNPTSIGMPKVGSWIMASVLGACTAQAGIQPILGARNEHVARKASFITAAVVAPFGILTAFLGMYARVILPDLSNAKMALPELMMSLPPVVGGIILASIFAAILSTISPIILAAGTMFTKDIYQRYWKKDASDKNMLFVSRLSTGIAGLVCIGVSIVMYGSTRILDMVYFAYTIRGALFIILLYGIYWKKTTENGAITSMVFTGVVGGFWVIFHAVTGFYPLADWLTETYAAVIVAIVATFIFSLIFKDKNDEDRLNERSRN